MELGYQQEVFDISFEWVVNSKLVKTYYIRHFFCKTCKTRVRIEIMHCMQLCKTICNDTWKVITWGLTSFDQLCHLTYCALPRQCLHLLLFTHINQMSQTLIKGASYPNNFVFVLQFFYVYESCILQFVVCVCGFFFLVVLGLHSSELASKMHFESSKMI